MRPFRDQFTKGGPFLCRKNMFPGGRSTMVLRGLHPSSGPGPAVNVLEELLSSYLPALPAALDFLAGASYGRIRGVPYV